ncbi:MAG TPA: hypothetical protein PKC87_04460 [Candidatus Absconditabacterales bacterium]|nr:hypothetical protein [Candidatus Absconditabacterales bacterium]
MKKYFLLSFACIPILMGSFVFADNNTVLKNENSDTRQIKAGVTIPDQGLLQYVTLGFCNEQLTNVTRQNIMNIRPGQTKEICMVLNNATGDSVDIALSFVDTELSNQGNMVCSLGIHTGDDSLASRISFDATDYNITLAPQSQLIKKAKVHIPKNMTGTLRGCVGYQLDIKKPDNYTGIFFVVRRSVGLMEVNITGDIYNYGRRDDIVYTYNDNQMTILKTIAGIILILLVYYIVIGMKSGKKPSEKKINKKK